ncbi:VOC family protein [Actinomadura sp. KC216]|uniref:VOC family protein n=1 Tax=Actinomadura sp. KC216 TaxID=2530370 RepID=UPI001046FD89|nr:VOC family protein [Actinomadura sp. KC216]TDB83787.1 VOC family protein [Actinomadura sp. KC216]
MTGTLQTRLRGVDHAAYVTTDAAGTIRFYRDVMGLGTPHIITAKGWGPKDHPDFVHFFFDIGDGDRLAFFYYFGVDPDPETPRPDYHLAIHVRTEQDLLDWRARFEEHGIRVIAQIAHETIESIYVRDPNGMIFEVTRPLRELDERDEHDARLSLEALLDVLGEDDPTLEKVWRRKAELIEKDDENKDEKDEG